MERPKDLEEWAERGDVSHGKPPTWEPYFNARGQAARYALELEARIAELEAERGRDFGFTGRQQDRIEELEARIENLGVAFSEYADAALEIAAPLGSTRLKALDDAFWSILRGEE
jgi:hypothetical protein